MQYNCSEPEWVKHLSYFTVEALEQFYNPSWRICVRLQKRIGRVSLDGKSAH